MGKAVVSSTPLKLVEQVSARRVPFEAVYSHCQARGLTHLRSSVCPCLLIGSVYRYPLGLHFAFHCIEVAHPAFIAGVRCTIAAFCSLVKSLVLVGTIGH